MKRLFFLMLIVVLASSMAFAQLRQRDEGAQQDGTRLRTGERDQDRDRLCQDLTEEQLAEIAAIRAAARAEAEQAQTMEEKQAIFRKMMADVAAVIGIDPQKMLLRTRLRERYLDSEGDGPIRDRLRDRICSDEGDLQDCIRDRIRDRICDCTCDHTCDQSCGTICGHICMDENTDPIEPEAKAGPTMEQEQNKDGEGAGDQNRTRQMISDQDRQRLLNMLDLSDEQKAMLEQIRQRYQQQIEGVLTDEQLANMQRLRECLRDQRQRPDDKGQVMMRLLGTLDLTEAQKGEIARIMEAAKAACGEAQTAEEKKQIMERAQAAVKGVLTDEQLAKLERLVARLRQAGQKPEEPVSGDRLQLIRRILASLDLTEEQVTVIEGLLAEAQAALDEAETPEEKRAIIEQVIDAIKEVLTDEQLGKLERILARIRQGQQQQPGDCLGLMMRVLDALDLTEDQIAAIQAIREDAIAAIQEAETPEAKREIILAAKEAIMDVLTDEQIELMKEIQARLRQRQCDGDGEPAGPGPGDGTGDSGSMVRVRTMR